MGSLLAGQGLTLRSRRPWWGPWWLRRREDLAHSGLIGQPTGLQRVRDSPAVGYNMYLYYSHPGTDKRRPQTTAQFQQQSHPPSGNEHGTHTTAA